MLFIILYDVDRFWVFKITEIHLILDEHHFAFH